MVLERHHPTHYGSRCRLPAATGTSALHLIGPRAALKALLVAGAVVGAGLLAGVAAERGGLLGRVRVEGESMAPSLQPGDRLLWVGVGRPRAGQVVVAPDPRDPSRLLVKRVRTVDGDSVDLRGDNEGASTDSGDFGPVAARAVRGRVVYRYFPAATAGRLPGAGRTQT